MNLRAVYRIGCFLLKLPVTFSDYLRSTALVPREKKILARARWLHRHSSWHLRSLGYDSRITGDLPRSGLLVSNHLSYLDILAISAATPAVFVSKSEVKDWPVFGWLASMAGTVFVRRQSRMHVGAVNRQMEEALASGALVVVFPEGTSSDGKTLLPFRSALLESVLRAGGPIHILHLQYGLDDGNASNEACWWGDRPFLPHLLNLLTKKHIHAILKFRRFESAATNRKDLAVHLRAGILELMMANASQTQPLTSRAGQSAEASSRKNG